MKKERHANDNMETSLTSQRLGVELKIKEKVTKKKKENPF